MKRFKVLVGALACATVLFAGGTALAANPHFVQGPNFSVQDDQVTVSGKVAGLGNTESVVIELETLTACINPGSKGHKPPGLKRETTAGTFSVDNGNVTFSLSTDLRKCPGKHTRVFDGATVRVFVDGVEVIEESM